MPSNCRWVARIGIIQKFQQHSAVSIVIRLQAGWSRVFLSSEATRLVLGPTKPLIQWVMRFIPGGKAARMWSKPLTPSSTMVKNERRYISTEPICLHSVDRKNFTFSTTYLILNHSLEQWAIKSSVTACLSTLFTRKWCVYTFLVNKTNRCTEFQLYWYYYSRCFGQPFCPSSGVLSRTSALVHFRQFWWTIWYQ
jgi:hypothetical protein